MKDRPELIELICKNHCRFFRPGEKEELSCRGFDFLAESLALGNIEKWTLLFRDERPPERFEHDPRIERIICESCEFREDDCDFMGGEEKGDAVPCGGYVLIARLLRAGEEEVRGWLDE